MSSSSYGGLGFTVAILSRYYAREDCGGAIREVQAMSSFLLDEVVTVAILSMYHAKGGCLTA